MTCNRGHCRILLAVAIIVMAAPVAGVRAEGQTVKIGWLSQTVKRTLPLTYLDQPPQDEGIQGARLAIADNNTTGQFTGQSFQLVESVAPEDGDPAGAFRVLMAKGVRLVVTDLDAPQLLTIAALPDADHITLLDSGAADDRLRGAGLPREHPASVAEPGDVGRRAGSVSRRQALDQSAARRRPQ